MAGHNGTHTTNKQHYTYYSFFFVLFLSCSKAPKLLSTRMKHCWKFPVGLLCGWTFLISERRCVRWVLEIVKIIAICWTTVNRNILVEAYVNGYRTEKNSFCKKFRSWLREIMHIGLLPMKFCDLKLKISISNVKGRSCHFLVRFFQKEYIFLSIKIMQQKYHCIL